MRVDNVKVTMKIPVHFDNQIKTDMFIQKNHGKKAVKNAVGIPIEIIHDDGTRTQVGVAQDVQLVKDGEDDIIKVSGLLRYGGTSEEVKFTKDIITNVTLNGIGITK